MRADGEAAGGLERLAQVRRAGLLDDADDHRLGAARAEGDAERAGHDDREGEDPEDGLGFPQELAEPRHRELHQRMRRAASINHPAAAFR